MTAIQQSPTAPEVPRTGLPPAPDVPGAGRGYARAKRVMDALLAGAALLVLAPVIACVWVAVLVRLGRPALFLQERVTMGGRRFRLGKFRTMLPVDPSRGWETDEQRLTPFGAWLRATSLDELPSLWNILVGDMSIVGPRPLPSHYLAIYSRAQHVRHTVRAGLTGLAQVSGRNNVPWDARFDLDQRYVLLMGPLLDLTIIARTVTTVLSRDGVVEGDLASSTVYPGPFWTPGVRFVPRGASAWSALTPEDEHIADCGFRTRHDVPSGETCAELSVAWTGERHAIDLVTDVVTLLVSRARAADCATARIRLGDASAALSAAFREAGFRPAGDVTGADGGAVLAADIRCVDDPTPRGAGR